MAFSPENSAGFQIENRQIQHQGLSQKQRQSMEVLQLSLPELEQRLAAELALNPFIEVEEAPPELQTPEPAPENSGETPDDEDALENWGFENSDEWRDELPLPADPAEAAPAPAADFLLYSQAPGPSLQENLLQELALSKIPRGVSRKVCEALIDQLDEEGFLRTPVADVAMNCNVSAAAVEKALSFVQDFDPPGVGARSQQECWLLQLKRRGELTENFRRLLTELTGDLERNHPDEAARKLHISMEELKAMLGKLRHLNRSPVPAEHASPPVQPDLEITADGWVNYQHTRNELQPTANLDTWQFNYGGQMIIRTPIGLEISTDIHERSRRGYNDPSSNTNELIWNGQISKTFLKSKSLIVALNFYDLLVAVAATVAVTPFLVVLAFGIDFTTEDIQAVAHVQHGV